MESADRSGDNKDGNGDEGKCMLSFVVMMEMVVAVTVLVLV